MARTVSLYDSAVSRGRVMKQGEIVQIVVDGGGAMVFEAMDFMAAQKWAQGKPSSGNLLTDRGRLFERMGVVISRPGSMIPTRGSDKQLRSLARQMKQAGYDINEWNLPPELKSIGPGADEDDLKKAKEAKELKRAQEEANAENAARSAPPPDMDDPYAGMKR